MEKEQLKMSSVLEHDRNLVQKRLRKKISKKEKKKRGFIAEKSKDGVKKIIENIRRKDMDPLDRFKVKNWK